MSVYNLRLLLAACMLISLNVFLFYALKHPVIEFKAGEITCGDPPWIELRPGNGAPNRELCTTKEGVAVWKIVK